MNQEQEEQKFQRAYFRRVALLSLAAAGVLILLMIVLIPRAKAETAVPVYSHQSDQATVRLMPSPCIDPTAAIIIAVNFPPEMQIQFRHIESNWLMPNGSREDFSGCWMERGEEFFLIFGDGRAFRITKADFTKRKGMTGT